MPRVSMVVPVYKVEKYLSKCIDSILNQNFKDIELILVNDGSPDRSGEICDEYAKKDGRVIVIHKKNGGVSSARNVGIDKASGEYIMFVDSDDWIEDDCIDAILENGTDFDIIVGGHRTVFKSKKTDYPLMTLKGNNRILSDIFVSVTNTNNVIFTTPWAKLYKKSIIKDKHIYFDENLKLSEDLKFNLEFFRHANNILVVDKIVYNYNIDNDESATKKYFEDYYVYRRTTYGELENWLKTYNMEEYLKLQKIEVVYASIYHYIKNCDPEEAIKKISEIYMSEKNLFEEYPELLSKRLGGGYTKFLVQQNWNGLITLWKKRYKIILFKMKVKRILERFFEL